MALPKQSEDFPSWYQAIIRDAELAENGLARGSMVIRPWGYAIWEFLQRAVDERIKATGHENLYFPALIPQNLLSKEEETLEGFAPEVIVATHSGGKELEDALILRPTSETVIWDTYSRWIQSYRDLPLLYNQWANVFRAEMRSRLFLRTSEFLWQEGHTAHETSNDAIKETLTIMRDVYMDVIKNVLMIPGIVGRKSETERFPGAEETITYEAMMRDKKALQSCTSHYLGQLFAKTYGVQFQTRDGGLDYAYATSWGISTRIIGALIMSHGDDKGLKLPSGVAPKQVVIVPIYRNENEASQVIESAQNICNDLVSKNIRVKIDDRDEVRPGNKYAHWEQKGVPLRIEIGPRDLEANSVMVSSRLGGEKQKVSFNDISNFVEKELINFDNALYSEAEQFQKENTFTPSNYDEMQEYLNSCNGFVIAPWNGKADSEAKVKQDTKATIRCLPLSNNDLTSALETGETSSLVSELEPGAKCIVTGEQATELAVFAQAY
ncbi:MAG: proline--tRNA ligase [Acidimicrobiia bacterium]